ncbi:hypothetical protein [Rhodobacter sp. 24-YEA-8]|uniref:hypothetical protein n=1 Tax=Rhodobacter sp. 24-YEA-8 TaxID=1884310 RepID=UPI00115FFC33|nr:hypothetical protein [Rhodobacter sp. 24-YEA-8]
MSAAVESISLISAADLARAFGYSGPSDAFRMWCCSMKIVPVPGRRGWYDPRLVRRRLDQAQGLQVPTPEANISTSLVMQRRARNGAL